MLPRIGTRNWPYADWLWDMWQSGVPDQILGTEPFLAEQVLEVMTVLPQGLVVDINGRPMPLSHWTHGIRGCAAS